MSDSDGETLPGWLPFATDAPSLPLLAPPEALSHVSTLRAHRASWRSRRQCLVASRQLRRYVHQSETQAQECAAAHAVETAVTLGRDDSQAVARATKGKRVRSVAR